MDKSPMYKMVVKVWREDSQDSWNTYKDHDVDVAVNLSREEAYEELLRWFEIEQLELKDGGACFFELSASEKGYFVDNGDIVYGARAWIQSM